MGTSGRSTSGAILSRVPSPPSEIIRSAFAAISFLLQDRAPLRASPFSTHTFLPRFLSQGTSQRTICAAFGSWYLATRPTVRIIEKNRSSARLPWDMKMSTGLLTSQSQRRRKSRQATASNHPGAQARAQIIHQHHECNEHEHDRRGLLVLKGAKAGVHQVSDAAGADQAEHRGGPDIGFETVESKRNQI